MLSIKDLCFDINGTSVFDTFSLDVSTGEKVLILAKSGRGKTSLFKLIQGFEQPRGGTISVNGSTLGQAPVQDIRKHIFYLSQDIDLIDETIQELLAQILASNGLLDLRTNAIPGFLDMLELENDLLRRRVSDLSGGERQRVGLLIGFLLDRPIWLLDEPTAALDDTMKHTIADHILFRDNTMVIVSHDAVWQDHPSIRIERWT